MTTNFDETESRVLSISNRTNRQIGVLGRVLVPGKTESIPLRDVQGKKGRQNELAAGVNASLYSVSLDGDTLTASELQLLDAPKSGELVVRREVFTNPPTADVDAFKTTFVAPAVETVYSGTDLDGTTGTGNLAAPRNVTIKGTTVGGEALEQKDVVIVGIDVDNQVRSETITTTAIGASTNVTDAGTIAFKSVTQVTVPADASGSPGDYEIGFGNLIGLSSPLSQGALLAEWVDNAVPGSAGSVTLSGSSAPNGVYAPHATQVPNGAKDYILVYVPN